MHSHGQEYDEEAVLPVSEPATPHRAYGSHDGHSHSGHGHSGHDHSHSHSHNHGSEGGSENINLRGAALHIIGDLVQSVGVAAAGALIWWKQVRAPGLLVCPDKGACCLSRAISVPRMPGIYDPVTMHSHATHRHLQVALNFGCGCNCSQDNPRFQIADPICTFIFALLVLWTTRIILQVSQGIRKLLIHVDYGSYHWPQGFEYTAYLLGQQAGSDRHCEHVNTHHSA